MHIFSHVPRAQPPSAACIHDCLSCWPRPAALILQMYGTCTSKLYEPASQPARRASQRQPVSVHPANPLQLFLTAWTMHNAFVSTTTMPPVSDPQHTGYLGSMPNQPHHPPRPSVHRGIGSSVKVNVDINMNLNISLDLDYAPYHRDRPPLCPLPTT